MLKGWVTGIPHCPSFASHIKSSKRRRQSLEALVSVMLQVEGQEDLESSVGRMSPPDQDRPSIRREGPLGTAAAAPEPPRWLRVRPMSHPAPRKEAVKSLVHRPDTGGACGYLSCSCTSVGVCEYHHVGQPGHNTTYEVITAGKYF